MYLSKTDVHLFFTVAERCRGDKIKSKRETKMREKLKFIQSDATKFIIFLALLLANRKNGRFLLVKK